MKKTLFSKNGRRIFIVAGVRPDIIANLMALYSRNYKRTSVGSHLLEMGHTVEHVTVYGDADLYIVNPDIFKSDSLDTEFINKWAIGYSHESIMDCGNIYLFVENCTILEAKFLQHHPLYNGIELSTRYVEFDTSMTINNEYPDMVAEYLDVYDEVYSKAKEKYKDYPDKSVKAYSFDIARGFLPLSTLTSVGMSVTIKVIREILSHAFVTDLSAAPQLQKLANSITHLLGKAMPDVEWGRDLEKINDKERGIFTTGHLATHFRHLYIPDFRKPGPVKSVPEDIKLNTAFLSIYGILDYGSWRDLARHRTLHNLPFVYPDYGVEAHPWYSEMSGRDIRPAHNHVWKRRLAHLVPVEADVFTDKWAYIKNLRSGPAVHPTLRHFMGIDISDVKPYKPRAQHDIVEKTKVEY